MGFDRGDAADHHVIDPALALSEHLCVLDDFRSMFVDLMPAGETWSCPLCERQYLWHEQLS